MIPMMFIGVIVKLNIETAKHTQSKIRSAEGADIDVMTADVTKSEQCKALVDACMEKYGRIDVLVKYAFLPLSRIIGLGLIDGSIQ